MILSVPARFFLRCLHRCVTAWNSGWLALLWAVLPAGGWAQGTDATAVALNLEQSLTQLIEQTEPSVVSIARIRRPNGGEGMEGRLPQPGLEPMGNELRDIVPNQFAAGIIVAPPESDDRLILTVYHAVRGGPVYGVAGSGDGSRLQVHFTTRHVCPATIIAADPRSDLAVLKVDLRNTNLRLSDLRPVAWDRSPGVRKGQLVVTLGNPYWIARDGSPSAGWGMVANQARRPVALSAQADKPRTLDDLGGLIHLDTRLPLGSSGGAVVNLSGQLVGVTTSLAAIEGYERSTGFALPIDPSTRWIVQSLLAGEEVEYGFLGISPGTTARLPIEVTTQASAAVAETVHERSPAALAGLRRGDVILSVNDQPTYGNLDLMRQVTLHPPDAVVELEILRGRTETLTLSVKLGKWPVFDDEAIIATQRKWPVWRGLTVDYPTGRDRFLDTPPRIRPGVLVLDVEAGSRAQAAQLEPGVFVSHVNRTPVKTPAEFYAAVRNETGAVSLRVIDPSDMSKQVMIAE